MKKIIILVLMVISFTSAQENNKGRISMVFNGEKIDLPIRSVTIMKQNNILISIRAEYNDSTIQQMVAFEIGFKKLSPGDSALDYPLSMDINVRNRSNNSGKNLTFSIDGDGAKSGDEKNEHASYGIDSKGERLSWDINSFQLSINVANVIYTGKELKITGSFNGTFQSTIAPKEQIAEIKDCMFEIII